MQNWITKRHAMRKSPAGKFPRRHLALAASTLIALGLALLLLPGENAEAKRTAIPLDLELTPSRVSTAPEVAPVVAEQAWKEIPVKNGDSLSAIFSRADLSPQDLHELLSSSTKAKALNKIRPGQKLSFKISDDGQLDAMSFQIDKLNSIVFERGVTGFTTTKMTETPEIRQRVASATITSSLYRAAQDAGVSQGIIMELANIFGGVLDFVYDVRKDDYFIVIYEELYLNGELLSSGQILAAQYFNRGKSFEAYRYINKQGEVDYFSEAGESMRKAFIRTPVDFARISSRFSNGRRHPILNKIRAHKGVDYAAPRGTPIKAAGDGRISLAGRHGGYGNAVIIQHGQRYRTLYAHMQGFAKGVRTGSNVKQGQIIGYIGTTGLSTGPHLHYEFQVNGVHVDPLSQKLPMSDPIASSEKARFMQLSKPLMAQMDKEKSTMLALNNQR